MTSDRKSTGSGVLSDRELEIADLLSGRTYKEIGRELGLSPRTVRWHVANMCERLDCTGKNELIAILRERNIINE